MNEKKPQLDIVSMITDEHIDKLLENDEFRTKLVGKLLSDEKSAVKLMQTIESIQSACPRCAVGCWPREESKK